MTTATPMTNQARERHFPVTASECHLVRKMAEWLWQAADDLSMPELPRARRLKIAHEMQGAATALARVTRDWRDRTPPVVARPRIEGAK